MRSWLGVARPALAGRVLGGILAAATALAAGLPPAGAAGAGCEAPEGEAGGLCVFFGDLHAHTSYSDGELRPRDAYFYAWRVGKLDFLGLSDHAYSLNGRPEHVDDLLRAARQAQRPGEFVALPGAEWTQSTQGHINVFTWEGFPDRERQPVYPELYRWLESHVVLFAQFNHPGFDIQQNWDAFRYDPRADRVIELLEVGNGPFAHNTRYEGSYRLALDQGWRVGAANNSDVHRAEWGTATPSRTAVWARSLTESDLVEAIRSRRTYATEDPDARLIFRSGAAWMGEVLPLASRVPLRVALWDPDAGDGFASVQVIGNGGQVVREMALGGARRADLRFSVELGRGDAWFYVRAVQQDGDLLVSSPIWFAHPSGVRAAGLELPGTLFVVGREYRARAVLINDREQARRVQVRWSSPGWRSDPAEVEIQPMATVPVETVWRPARPGPQALVLELVIPGGGLPNRYPQPVRVRERALGRLLVDEAHNNRYTGLAGAFLERLRQGGVDASAGDRPWTLQALQETDLLVAAVPEPGFSLTPATFAAHELEALARWVRDGGRVLLAGGLDPDGGRHGVDQLNRILTALGAHLRFRAEPLEAGAPAVGTRDTPGDPAARIVRVVRGLGAGAQLYLRRPSALGLQEGPLSRGAVLPDGVDVLAWGGAGDAGEEMALVARERVGAGSVTLVVAPTYSPYEHGQRGFDDASFEDGLVGALLARP